MAVAFRTPRECRVNNVFEQLVVRLKETLQHRHDVHQLAPRSTAYGSVILCSHRGCSAAWQPGKGERLHKQVNLGAVGEAQWLPFGVLPFALACFVQLACDLVVRVHAGEVS